MHAADSQHSDHAHAPTPPPAALVPVDFTPGEAKQARRLKMVLAMVSAFFVLELIGALLAGAWCCKPTRCTC